MSDKRYRSFHIILYPDSTSYDCSSVICSLSNSVDTWAYIIHDKDYDNEGNLKKVHVHFVIRYPNARTFSAVSREYGIPQNHIEKCDFNQAVRYLTHGE